VPEVDDEETRQARKKTRRIDKEKSRIHEKEKRSIDCGWESLSPRSSIIDLDLPRAFLKIMGKMGERLRPKRESTQ
jgi:hypothetical protein